MTVVPSDFNRNKDNRIRRRGLRRAGNDFPDGPVAGDIFYEIDANILWLYNGVNWEEIGGGGGTSTTPVGMITAYWGITPPATWLLCDGAAIPVEYTDLIALVGANTPNLKGKVIVGVDAAQAEFDALGETGGAKTIALSTAEMPSHGHNFSAESPATGTESTNHVHGTGDGGAVSHSINGANPNDVAVRVSSTEGLMAPSNSGDDVSFTNINDHPNHNHGNTSGTDGNHAHTVNNHGHGFAAEGGSTAHSNLQPYAALSYIIKT